MRRLAALLTTAAIVTVPLLAAAVDKAVPVNDPVVPKVAEEKSVTFAARLAQAGAITGPSAWMVTPPRKIWDQVAMVTDRQPARWAYARSLIGQGLGSEALGVLETMRQDSPDLAMVDAFRIARGAAQGLAGHWDVALDDLGPDASGASKSGEGCAWLMRALAETGRAEPALRFAPCAGPALAQRSVAQRAPFLIAAARAAVEGGQAQQALHWLAVLPDRDAAANLYRGRAYAALGQSAAAHLRLARVLTDGPLHLRIDAKLADIEAGVADKSLTPVAALGELTQLRYRWRGDAIEERALRLSYRLSKQVNDNAGALSAGATLLRYYPPSKADPQFAAEVRDRYRRVAETGGVPLDRAAGLFWAYRDLLPAGVEGDQMVGVLAGRLQQAGLYERAATLLQYQLLNRVGDMAKGPSSARVAALFILSGRPGRAITTLRKTDNPDYTPDMLAERRRVEAVALHQLGRGDQALALLDQVPDSGPLRAEMLWRQKRWQTLVDAMTGLLPRASGVPTHGLSAVEQTMILRQAVALAMLGRGGDLASLHARYGAAFAGAPGATVFNLIAAPGAVGDPVRLGQAMVALPSVSPAGAMADLFDVAPVG
jgi:hypothetical protein